MISDPPMIHRYWTGPKVDPNPWIGAVVRRNHPQHQSVDWTDATLPRPARELIAEIANPRHRANVVRWWLLEAFGGTWLDHDVLPLVPIDTLPMPATAEHRDGTRCNCLLRFPAGSTDCRRALAKLGDIDWDGPSFSSGEILLNEVTGAAVPRLRLPIDADAVMTGAPALFVHLHATSGR